MDDEKLVEEVEKHRCLYDRSSIGYRNIRKRAKAWDEISATMDVNISTCQTRWRSMKDRYLREMKKEACASGSAVVSAKKQWKFLQRLAFLKDHTRPRRVTTLSQIQALESQVLDEQLFSPDMKFESEKWENSPEIDDVNGGPGMSSTPYSSPNMSEKSFRKRETAQAESMSVMTMARERLQSADPNKNYLKHLSEKLEELPKEEKDETKLFFLTYVYNQIKELNK